MHKIRLFINKETSFVYHMLSVSQCGYENAHGAKYRHLYPAEDLDALKRYENLLTVSGGEHCGALYWHLVCLPARGNISARQYYENFQKDLPEHLSVYTDAISSICAVITRSYPVYEVEVWPESRQSIEDYIRPLAEKFAHCNFTEAAEREVGIGLETPVFYAIMTDSMENGPEAIDISPDQDVFSITRPVEDNFRFIAHEYIIYLLKAALRGTSAFQNYHTWEITEALADYYLSRILGETGIFSRNHRWVAFYEAMAPQTSPSARYLAAEAALDKPAV